jgi:hypothetical protein
MMTYAEDDKDWSAKVALRYDCTCGWAGCTQTFGLGGHHIIPRGVNPLRLVIENGLLLCTRHHNIVESVKGTKAYNTVMTVLVGKKRYLSLLEAEKEYLSGVGYRSDVIEISSEVDL